MWSSKRICLRKIDKVKTAGLREPEFIGGEVD